MAVEVRTRWLLGGLAALVAALVVAVGVLAHQVSDLRDEVAAQPTPVVQGGGIREVGPDQLDPRLCALLERFALADRIDVRNDLGADDADISDCDVAAEKVWLARKQ
ncbi:hypothetical protein EV189_2010 [Motilibacter rhizosphaerae]|uniref:Uncharacterized protein n=1 Tax=Motilibacter rhizosphaerae TaxID=598652 RepID=A0A4Q7NSU5_9ACTN|nr:hypothetical protein [Motilibacter rhizosphaerae]RZS90226.1 hypothetical protein EV189_2010 [Motilibacter rhizosphaerae]